MEKDLSALDIGLFEGLELGWDGVHCLLMGSVVSRAFCTERRSFASFLHIALPRYVQRCQDYFCSSQDIRVASSLDQIRFLC